MGLEFLLVQWKLDTLASHHRIQHRIRHFNGMQPFLRRSDQLSTVENRRYKVLLDAYMLFAVATADWNVDVPHRRNAERTVRRLRELIRRHFVTGKRQTAAFADQFAARADYFQAIRSRGFASRRHKHARCAVWIFVKSCDFVFYFDVVVFSNAADGGDG